MSELRPVISCVVVAAPMLLRQQLCQACQLAVEPLQLPLRSCLSPRPYKLFRVSAFLLLRKSREANPKWLNALGRSERGKVVLEYMSICISLGTLKPIYENFKQVDGGARFCIL